MFYYLMDLHYSQTIIVMIYGQSGFTTLWIYTILKHHVSGAQCVDVLLPYGFTLFSNQEAAASSLRSFYYLMDLHYSQTVYHYII